MWWHKISKHKSSSTCLPNWRRVQKY